MSETTQDTTATSVPELPEWAKAAVEDTMAVTGGRHREATTQHAAKLVALINAVDAYVEELEPVADVQGLAQRLVVSRIINRRLAR